jgi:hypothetical protein
MFKFILLSALFGAAPIAMASDAAVTPVRLRNAAKIHLRCYLNSETVIDINGSSSDLTVNRVIDNTTIYEISRDEYFIASCVALQVVEP